MEWLPNKPVSITGLGTGREYTQGDTHSMVAMVGQVPRLQALPRNQVILRSEDKSDKIFPQSLNFKNDIFNMRGDESD